MVSKTDKIIVYFVEKSKKIDRLKLMKLMFLAEYYNLKDKKIEPKKNIGNSFIIYSYGVFSFEVYNELFDLLSKEEIVEDGKVLKTSGEVNLDKETEKRLDFILEKFDKFDGWELADITLKMLKIKKDEKYRYNGIPVEAILLTNN